MIDYSVYMMTPTYSKDETPKAYAKNQVSEIWSLEKFAKHISDHNGVYSRGTVKGVISDMCECLVEQLLNGNKIQLGELGTFGISISSEGAESIEKFREPDWPCRVQSSGKSYRPKGYAEGREGGRDPGGPGSRQEQGQCRRWLGG